MKNNWFVVDKNGLKQLQAGKSKTFIINELVQNAFDENITFCKVDITRLTPETVQIRVEDDNPEGFKDIRHAYTLFADTYKRRDVTKRGRFNLGEKQVISICNNATVVTTKGTIVFDDEGRHEERQTTEEGSIIFVEFDCTEDEYNELIEHTKLLIAPPNIQFIVNGTQIETKQPSHSFSCVLATEVLQDDVMRTTNRKTDVHLIPANGESYIYEMGIPIVKTDDCPWHIDIQQKVVLAVDREALRPFYYKDLYAEVLNVIYDELTEENCSETWVRIGMKHPRRIKKETVQGVLNVRFGDKFLSSNPFDPNANDEAIAHGYRVITGSEMSKDEWARAKEYGVVHSTTEIFGEKEELLGATQTVDINDEMKLWSKFCKKVAKDTLGINDLQVRYVDVSNKKAAYYCPESNPRSVTFNVHHLGKRKFFQSINERNLDLLIHELGHECGNHTEHSYHKCITNIAAQLIIKAKHDPKYFEYN